MFVFVFSESLVGAHNINMQLEVSYQKKKKKYYFYNEKLKLAQ